MKEQDLALPILDKIYKKTLCLNNYILNDGNCRALAAAGKVLDHHIVNRFLFNNCKITGDQLAQILDGLKDMKDVKSLIYKSNEINEFSLNSLIPILDKRLPHHLTELKIVDCKINA